MLQLLGVAASGLEHGHVTDGGRFLVAALVDVEDGRGLLSLPFLPATTAVLLPVPAFLL